MCCEGFGLTCCRCSDRPIVTVWPTLLNVPPLLHQLAALLTLHPPRFKWPDHPQVKFSPAVGHLLAGSSKRITATFLSAAPVRLEGQELKLQVTQIQYKGAPTDWDDVIAAAAVAAAPPPTAHPPAGRGAGGKGAAGRGGAVAAALPGGEPLHDVVPKTQKDVILKVGCAFIFACLCMCLCPCTGLAATPRLHSPGL